jgi:hypothetical protein
MIANNQPITATTNLYLDPLTMRIVYLTQGAEFPVKTMVLDDGKLRLFAPNTFTKILFTGELPRDLSAQNCWDFQLQINESKKLSLIRVKTPAVTTAASTTENSQLANDSRAVAA